MHTEIIQWFSYTRLMFPQYFRNMSVLDVGALDVNGNNREFFKTSKYTGLDIGPGPNVDVVSICHEFEQSDCSYDVVISSDSLEHDMHWEKTLKKMCSLLRHEGLMIFTCASEGRGEHGTLKEGNEASPLTTKDSVWQNYYRNLTEKDIRSVIDIESTFLRHEFSVIVGGLKDWGKDLRFWGLKNE